MSRRDESPRYARVRGAAPVLVLLVVLSCGGADEGGDASTEGWPRRVELAYEGPPRSAEGARVVSKLNVPPDVAPWVVEKGTYKLAPIAGEADEDQKGLLFQSNATTVVIPGPFDPTTFNHVALTYVSRLRGNLGLHLRREGEPVASVGGILIKDEIPVQRLEVPVRRNRREQEPYDDLVIQIRRSPILLMSVELFDKPVELWVPDPADGPTVAAIGDDGRHAVAVPDGGSLSGRFIAREDTVLELSYAQVEETRRQQEESTLVVTLKSPTGWSETFELPVKRPPQPAWSDHRHPLDGGPGGELAIEIRHESSDGGSAFAWVGEVTVSEPVESPPTVLLVTSDTHRGDHVGLSGHGVDVRTPALDALANRGVFFEWCQTSCNITLPSHIALLTGQHPRDTGIVKNNSKGLTEQAITLAEVFRGNGYRTLAAVSAIHLGDRISGLAQGFDRIAAPESGQRLADHTVGVITDWIAEFEGQPLFVWLHVFDAHAPYRGDDGQEEYEQLLVEFKRGDDDAVDRLRGLYRNEVNYLDGELGRLLELPRFRDGIVAVTADHGESLGKNGVYFDHLELFTDTLHVPLIVAWPGSPAGVRVPAPVRQIDVGRTLLDLAGHGSSDFPGDNLVRYVDDPPEPRPIFALSSLDASASITSDGWHLILHLREHEVGDPRPVRVAALHEVELYRLTEKLECEENLVESRPEIAARLRQGLVSWLGQARDLGWSREADLSASDVADLAALGYAADTSSGEASFDPDCECEWCERFR